MGTHDEDTPTSARRTPANRLGLDYRQAPTRRVTTRIVDIHSHVRLTPTTAAFFEAADTYGIAKIVSMSPIEDVPGLQQQYPERLEFIAVPRWRELTSSDAFRDSWLADLEKFAEYGARRMKFWVAPPMRGKHGLTLTDAYFRPVIAKGLELDFDFMIHVGDPSEWFAEGQRYADAAKFGTKREQYRQLEFLLEAVAPHNVIAAHMGGSVEEPEFLDTLLRRYPNLYLDSSATKWIVRGVARRPQAVRDLFLAHPERILFGSDLVVGDDYDFDHYASRYWVHQMMWETSYRGESPIEDPDAENPPPLAGIDLPADVLWKFYGTNAARLGY